MKIPPFFHRFLAAALLLSPAALLPAASPPPEELEWVRKPGENWRSSAIRPLSKVEGFTPRETGPKLSRHGGNTEWRRREATGFFRVEKINDRWWTIDPEGYLYINMGLTSIRPTRHASSRPYFEQKFRNEQDWAAQTTDLMRSLGFNEIGRWSRLDVFNKVENPLPYTTSFQFMATFGRGLGITRPSYGHALYPDGAIPVFHPDFEQHVMDYAREHLRPLADDPLVMGHFTDNELPMSRQLLANTLAMSPDDESLGANVREARRWLRQRRGNDSRENITAEENLDWLAHVMDRYYALTTTAIRRYAPNHMNLGSRLHGAGPNIPQVIEVAGRHLDVVSINYYNVWEPRTHHLEGWAQYSEAPVIITEFYVKGEDAAEEFGLRNELGAGWVVRDQTARGLWYQNFPLRLLESPIIVGWQYFKYADEADDSNKGILNPRYEKWEPLTDAMAPIHRNAYDLIRHFENQ